MEATINNESTTTEPNTNTVPHPEEECQICDKHDEDSWLHNSFARRSGMGHTAEQVAWQQALQVIQD